MRTLICSFLMVSAATLSAANTDSVDTSVQTSVNAQPTTTSAPIKIDDRQWKVGHEAKEDGRLIREYVLENEDPNSWTELFSIQEFNDVPVTPQEFFKLFVDGLKQAVPQNKVDSKVISDSPKELIGEWWVNDKSPNDQHEWIKIVKDGDEILIARYTTKKVDDVEKDRKKWEDFLKNFQIKKEV